MKMLVASVGVAGRNLQADVRAVQGGLKSAGESPGAVDGICGPATVGAILRFQSRFMARPDGRVDPQGSTWAQLAGRAPAAIRAVPPAVSLHSAAASGGLTTLVPKPDRASINKGLLPVSSEFMLAQLGKPRESFTADCAPLTDARLKRATLTAVVGPMKVTGLRPAIESLQRVLAQIQREQPQVYDVLGTAGMLCCRWVRGSTTAISNHSWGTAIDLTLNKVLDKRGDNRVQLGLTLIAPIFNAHGWYWGAAFRTEDAMHFEASQRLISEWAGGMT